MKQPKPKQYDLVKKLTGEYRIILLDPNDKTNHLLGASDGVTTEPYVSEEIEVMYTLGGLPYKYFFEEQIPVIKDEIKIIWRRNK